MRVDSPLTIFVTFENFIKTKETLIQIFQINSQRNYAAHSQKDYKS